MRYVAVAGVCEALAVGFWLPYIVSFPALLFWALVNRPDRRFEAATVLFLTTALAGSVLFGLGAHFRGVASIADFRAWVVTSGHGMKQTHNLIRSIFGLPRSFLELGQFGVSMKQFIFKDPYARVSIGELLGRAIWKIVLFYLALFSLSSLWLTDKGKRVLMVFVIALVLTMALAIAFEAGSAERYLPLYPFLFLAVTLCLCIHQAPRVVRIALYSLCFLIIGNVASSSAIRVHAEQGKAVQRLKQLLPLPPKSLLFVVGDDSISRLRLNEPFYEINERASFETAGLYAPMMSTASWKRDFANEVLAVWKEGGSIWITTRVWAEQPQRAWNWVEGDDPNIAWKDIVQFFKPLEHNGGEMTEDGFALLMRSARNQARLESFASASKN
jgi:hypothetical protein